MWASLITAAGTSLVSLGVWLYLIYGSDFEEHYATSALASVVLIGVWLYLSNALILLAYRATQYRDERSNGHRGGATAGREMTSGPFVALIETLLDWIGPFFSPTATS